MIRENYSRNDAEKGSEGWSERWSEEWSEGWQVVKRGWRRVVDQTKKQKVPCVGYCDTTVWLIHTTKMTSCNFLIYSRWRHVVIWCWFYSRWPHVGTNYMIFSRWRHVTQSCPRVGLTRGSGRVGSGHNFAGFWRVGSGRVGSALRIF